LTTHGKDVMRKCVKRCVRRTFTDEQQKLRRLADAAIDIYAIAVCVSRASRSVAQKAPSAEYETRMVSLITKQVRAPYTLFNAHTHFFCRQTNASTPI
jgi:hypothetical protein